MVKVVARVASVPTLLIKKIAAETAALLAEGAPIINISQGSPNLPMFEVGFKVAHWQTLVCLQVSLHGARLPSPPTHRPAWSCALVAAGVAQ